MTMEASKISRLREEQQKAVSETEEKIRQIEKYKADYKALHKRLKTLPDKITHDVMVPFGKLAFMPGQLVHTNEILVLLGDNWFAERSATQACEVAGRRIKELDKRITELKEQKSLLEPRLGVTSELQNVAEGLGGYKEIVEEYDEEKERLWDEQHKKNLRLHHERMREQRSSSKPGEKGDGVANIKCKSNPQSKSDEDFWARLEVLERQEEERGELNSSFDSEHSESPLEDSNSQQRKKEVNPNRDKRVNWMDEKVEDSDDEEDSDDDGDDEDESEEHGDSDNEVKPVTKIISFRHTKVSPPVPNENQDSAAVQGHASTSITTPADIIKLLSVKPILKKKNEQPVRQSVRFPDGGGDRCPLTRDIQEDKVEESNRYAKSMDTSRDKAFTGIVKENPATNHPPSTTSITTSSQEQPKRVSKFRAQRMGQRP